MRYGYNFPLDKTPLLEQRAWIEEIERLGYDDVWTSEATQFDGMTALALAAQWSKNMRIGCGAFPVQTRGPALLAQSIASLTHAAPGRLVVGLCASSQAIVEWWNDRSMERPYYQVKDTIEFLERAWSGELVSQEWESFRVKNYKQRILPTERPPLLVAGLRDAMIRLGARDADGVILNMCTPDDVRKMVPLIRRFGDDKEIAMRICMVPTEQVDLAKQVAKQWAVGYFTTESYRTQQEGFGRGALLAESNELWAKGDRKGALAALPDEAIECGWVIGSPEECRARCLEYEAAGLDTLILSHLEDLCDPWESIRALAPRR